MGFPSLHTSKLSQYVIRPICQLLSFTYNSLSLSCTVKERASNYLCTAQINMLITVECMFLWTAINHWIFKLFIRHRHNSNWMVIAGMDGNAIKRQFIIISERLICTQKHILNTLALTLRSNLYMDHSHLHALWAAYECKRIRMNEWIESQCKQMSLTIFRSHFSLPTFPRVRQVFASTYYIIFTTILH